jgi:feruloyl esterase
MSHSALVTAAFLTCVALPPPTVEAASCERLSALKLPDTTIALAAQVPAGGFAPPPGSPALPGPPAPYVDLPPFCRVAATLTPSSDSEIRIEVWMPTSGWNGKLQAVGNGGWWGAIIYPALGEALQRGYATAGTDTGHTSGVMDASWALGHPEKVTDFAYRAVHLMTVRAKQIIAAFYGAAPKLSYWNGCSSGGKQGLKEAQRFPEDFDGIVAGAPAWDWTHLTAETVWAGLVTLKDPADFIPKEKYALLHDAALDACDVVDGVKDGLIDDPRRCPFDPEVLRCPGEESPTCLTAAQVRSAKRLYGPATFSNGRPFFPGLEPGSELGWGFLTGGPEPNPIGSTHYKYLVHVDPGWDPRTMNFDEDVPLADRLDHGTIAATDPDLDAFEARGGKLIMYHGWADALIVPRSSISYYEKVVSTMGGLEKTRAFFRLFMAPGMGHCHGGEGPDDFDALGALEAWVEQGQAPEKVIASHRTDGRVDRTRPLCPYPEHAKWKGSGSTDDAASFSCVD